MTKAELQEAIREEIMRPEFVAALAVAILNAPAVFASRPATFAEISESRTPP